MTRITAAAAAVSLAATLFTPPIAHATTITFGATCSLAEAIESANTNVAVAGCNAGAVGRDRIVVEPNVTLSTVDNTSNSGPNGLPVVIEDLLITSPDPAVTSFITRDYTLGTPEFRLLEIGTATAAPSVIISRIDMQNGRVGGSIPPWGSPAPARAGASDCGAARSPLSTASWRNASPPASTTPPGRRPAPRAGRFRQPAAR